MEKSAGAYQAGLPQGSRATIPDSAMRTIPPAGSPRPGGAARRRSHAQESGTMSETMPHADEVVAPTSQPWDPFQLMDRLDEEALRKELEGVAGTDLVYVVKEGGQEVVGLSKTGVDECCLALVAQGQVIREEDLQYEVVGDGEDREALFKVKAARFAVSPEG